MSQSPDLDAPPPAKRQRTDSESSITRSDVWRNDGNVVLQAETTQFRVHWSVLSLHSPFFRDMRDLPRPNDQPTVEGCPVIELHDPAEDVEHLLNALYNPLIFSEKSLPFPFIAGIVRLGRKYDFKKLLEAAVQRLINENPTTLEEYEKLTGEDNISYSSTQISHYRGMSFDVITLARENGLFTVLPCAYLCAVLCTCANPKLLLDGISRKGGPPITLAPREQRVCILGERKIMEAQWKQNDLWNWLNSDLCADGCADNTSCIRRKKNVFRTLVENGSLLVPFRLAPGQRLCVACQHRHAQIMVEERKKLWEELPSFFDLPPWAELKNDLY